MKDIVEQEIEFFSKKFLGEPPEGKCFPMMEKNFVIGSADDVKDFIRSFALKIRQEVSEAIPKKSKKHTKECEREMDLKWIDCTCGLVGYNRALSDIQSALKKKGLI